MRFILRYFTVQPGLNERDSLLLLDDKLDLLEFLIIYVDKDITDYFVEVIINKKKSCKYDTYKTFL